MTDKQIIIDGADVSECELCDWKGSDIPRCRIRQASFEPTCKGYNCYYKQFKAKEQECEELNEHSVGFARKCQKLELDVCHLKDKNYNLQRQLDQLKAENEKLKQTLTEINEIAERGFQHSQCNCGAKADLDSILQKISECEVENDQQR